ncbi:MAG TPA: VOC family protein [Actinomycetota bacterium]|nr:VOC family protein [Actinomycetota bacterium]
MGEPSHFELGVPDGTKARAFFQKLLGWEFETTSGENAWINTPGVRGGLHSEDPESSITLYFSVPDIEVAVQLVRDLGGKADDPGPPGNSGRYASCHDNQGVRFGLHQPPKP